MTFTEDLRIDCAPSTAFDLLADVRNETQWNDGVSQADLMTDEPVGLGSKFVTDHGSPLGKIESTITARISLGQSDRQTTLALPSVAPRPDDDRGRTVTPPVDRSLRHR